ncbi:MAG: GGDEF domain-containing protein [Butyrivibrio sp.]|nr:GGDEF domain-containing protein [Butyrivibrio sp.]
MINGKRLVTLCTYRIFDAQEFAFISELNRLLNQNNCALFIYALNTEIANNGYEVAEVSVFQRIAYDKTDVIIIIDEKIKCREVCQDIIDKAASADIPVIIIDGEYENTSTVRYSYGKGFEAVVRHVIEGHRVKRPHMMAGKKTSPFSIEREEVFKKVLEDNSIPFDDSMISYGDFWSIPCRAAAEKILEREEIPEAIICANDIMAINVCDVFQNAGYKVPRDLIVTGFDGIKEAFFSNPGITTAKCDGIELAQAVMEVLAETFNGKRNISKWILPTFISNESCGCAKSGFDVVTAVNGLNNIFYHHQDDLHMMQKIASKLMVGRDMEGNLRFLKKNLAKYACVVVEDSCFDQENNFFFDKGTKGGMTVVFDSYSDNTDRYPYDPQTIIPHLDEILQKGYPVIFNGLEYMAKSPGFVCYSFPKVELIDYTQTANLTNCFSMGIGGYVINNYQKYLREKLREMYEKDALTGLYNRLAFVSIMDEMIKESSNFGKKVTIIMSDLNGLKKINDSLGHLYGDKAIAATAKALKQACPEDAVCVRVGGDEMLALILGECDIDRISKDFNEILEKYSDEYGFRVSASIGTHSTIFDKSIDMNKVVSLADGRMYEMKRESKNNERKEKTD